MPAPSSFQHAWDCVLGARGSAYLPSACLASHGLQGMAGPAHSLPRSPQPPLALEGGAGQLTAGHPLGPARSFCHLEFWEAAVLSTSSAELRWLLRDARGEALQGARSVY